MNLRAKAGKGSILLTAGEGVGYGASLIRNMILARMLAKSDFGIAAAFGMIMLLFEFSNKLGIARFVIRDKEGDDPDFVEAAHGVQAISAILSAMLIVAVSPLLAQMFDIPGQSWVLASLAVVAVFRGFHHLDIRRFERDLRFAPSMLTEVVPQIAITIAAWPVALWLKDYRVMLVLLLVKAMISCVLSHLLSDRTYRWRWHRSYVVRMLRFGWPLVVNGFLMVGVLQGDKYLVAIFYSMLDLAPYAAAAALVMAPTFMFGRVFNSIAFPLLAKVQDDPLALQRRYRQVIAGVTLFATVSATGFILGAEAIMPMVYGEKYLGTGVLLAWMAASDGFRSLRFAPGLAALAKGDSKNQMYSNFGRSVALLPALGVALAQAPIWLVAAMGLLGEVAACAVSVIRLKRRDDVPFSATLLPTLWLALLLLIAGGFGQLGLGDGSFVWTLLLAASGATIAGILTIGVLRELRTEISRLSVSAHQLGSRWARFRETRRLSSTG